MKGLCLCWLCPRRPLWLLTVQRKVNSDCVSVSLCSNLSECTNSKKDYSEKEHSNSDSICYKKSLTWSSAYVQPHFALNVNLMHRWSRHTEIVKKKKKRMLHQMYCSFVSRASFCWHQKVSLENVDDYF